MPSAEYTPLQIEPELIQDQLDRILSSKAFAQASRLRSFLRYIVGFALEGGSGPLKEAMIGAAVYEKHPAYDTKEEPIVRIEARRLRTKLDFYYQSEGAGDPILIQVPKGGYLPSFKLREQADEEILRLGLDRSRNLSAPPAFSISESLPDPTRTGSKDPEPVPLPAATASVLAAQRLSARWIAGIATIALICMVAGVWYVVQSRRASRHTALAHVEPLTSSPGRVIQAALSPDGREIAYAWNGLNKGANFDIYVKQTEIGTPLRLTNGSAQDLHPAWSPDGRYLAFLRVSPDASEVVTVPALGGPERVIAQIQSRSPWKADGAQIEFEPGPAWSPRGGSIVCADSSSQDQGVGLFEIPLDGGQKRRLTTAPPLATDGYPAFSPDGSRLAFVRQFSNSVRDIFVYGMNDHSVRQITSEGVDIRGLTWSHDGRYLEYSSNRGGSYELWRVAAEGGTPENLLASGDQLTDPFEARDGSSLLYTDTTEESNIWRVALNASSQRAARTEGATELIASTRHNNSPQYSPDGRSIGFISDRSGSWEVWIAESDGSSPQQLTHFGGPMVGTPHWSPDSRSLVFDARPNGKSEIFIVSIAGGAPQQITHNQAENKMPNWSRDGHWIYYSSNVGGMLRLWKQSVAGGEPVRLTATVSHDSFESVDGRSIYFQTTGRGIWRVGTDGTGEARVPELATLFPNRYMAIGASGLYFVDSESAPGKIQRYRFSDHRIETVGAIPKSPVDGTPSLSVSPDERWIVFAQQDQGDSSIMRLQNLP